MVQKWPDESDMQEGDKSEKKGNHRFSYQSKKQKTDPWASIEPAGKRNYGPIDGTQKFGHSSINDSKTLIPHSDFNLESVWSVKNVPLPSNKKQPSSQVNPHAGNSYYSRHTGGLSGFQTNHASKLESTGDVNNNPSSWSMKRQGYSYASHGSVKRQADDDDDEFDFTEPKKKSTPTENFTPSPQLHQGISGKPGPLASFVNPQRKESARTQRAQKMHDAYLRSAGLGNYTNSSRDNGVDPQ